MEIKFENVSFNNVVKDINLKIEKGQIVGIVGSSGSGKTTLIEMIDALVFPTNGRLLVGDFVLEKGKKYKNINELRFNVGFVFEDANEQIFSNTVYDEVAFAMRYFKYKKEQIETQVKKALMMVGLPEDYLYKNPFNLSHGETKKLAIACVLAFNPEIVIFDEPLTALDNASKKNLIKIIRTLKTRYEKTVIIVSQDTDFLHKIVDRVYVMHKGNIVMAGNKYEIFQEEELLNKYDVRAPKVISFSKLVEKKKGIKMGYRDDINDLIKDVYRYVK
jgi:energy-coupling factor transporter ATP-binding protein EcfA2